MQQNSTNNHLHNLKLSYSFYQSCLAQNINALKARHEEQLLVAAKKIERIFKYEIIKDCFRHHLNLRNTYYAMLELDWADFFDYYDLLDAFIFGGYSNLDWNENRQFVCKADSQSALNVELAFYSLKKLQKIIPQIFFELYRDHYGINHYSKVDPDSLKEQRVLTAETIYKYLLHGQEPEAIEAYTGYEEKVRKIKDDAAKYLKSIELATETLYQTYGDKIYPDLDRLLTRSYNSRLNAIAFMIISSKEEDSEDFHFNLNYESFFTIPEFLTFRLTYPDFRKEPQVVIDRKKLVEQDVKDMIDKFGPGIEKRYRNLYCYLIMLQHLVAEYMQLHR